MTDSAGFRILTVCTGNICRSPAAHWLLEDGLGRAAEVSSGGTGAVVGHPVEPQMRRLLSAGGAADRAFAARQLDQSMVRDADLVLALTKQHRAAALRLSPATLRRAFTLLEFARIVGAPGFPALQATTVEGRLAEMTDLAGSRRQLGEITGDDVPDPYRQSDRAFQESFVLIHAAVASIVRAATGAA